MKPSRWILTSLVGTAVCLPLVSIATEDLVSMFSEMGVETGVDLGRLVEVMGADGRGEQTPLGAPDR